MELMELKDPDFYYFFFFMKPNVWILSPENFDKIVMFLKKV